MNNYKIEQTKENILRPGGKVDTVLKVYKKNKGKINEDELKEILKSIKDSDRKKGTNIQTMVRGENIHKMTTMKGFENDDYIDYDDDYYEGHVDSAEEFKQYFYVEITIRKNR